MSDDIQTKLDGWLAQLRNPRLTGREANAVIAEMQLEPADRILPLLLPLLTDPAPGVRADVAETLLRIDLPRTLDRVLPLLFDSVDYVRWHVCGCLHDFPHERAIPALIQVLQRDSDAGIRGTAAYSLGGIASPAAIPALLAAMEADHESDSQGHSASSGAATALDEILGTEETRFKLSPTLRRIRLAPPDLNLLKRLALERFERWTCDGG